MNKSIKTLTNFDVLNIIKGGGEFNQTEDIVYNISTDLKVSFLLINDIINKINISINRNNNISIIYKLFNKIALELSLLIDLFHEYSDRIIKDESKTYTIENFENRINDLKHRTITLIEQQQSNNGRTNGIPSYKTFINEIINDKIIPVYNEILELYSDINNE